MSGAGRVLLTGATGFVGAALAVDLAARGWRVRAAVRRPGPALAGVAEQVEANLSGAVDWGPALAGVDAVVHAAGIAHAGPGLPDTLYDTVNRAATLDLARAAAGRAGRMVFLSSIRAQSGPTSPAVLSEADPPAPTDAYGRSKLAAEDGLAAIDLPVAALRPVVVYGPGVKGNVATLLRLARLPLPLPFGALRAPRSFLALENLCEAVAHLLAREQPARGALVAADPEPTTVAALLEAMRRAEGRSPGLVAFPAAPMAAMARLAGQSDLWDRLAGPMQADPARLLSLGWRPPVRTTPEGVARWLGPGRTPGRDRG